MAWAHHSHIFQPHLLQHHRARVHSKISNRNPEHIAELGSIQISNHVSSHFAELRSDWKFPMKPPSRAPSSFPFHFWPPARLDRRSGVRLEISNQKPYHIVQLGSNSGISQGTSMARSEHIPSYRPIKFLSCALRHTPVSNSIPSHHLPHTHPITHTNHPPSLLPLAPPLLHITHGMYQAALGGHTGYTALVFKAVPTSGSLPWCIRVSSFMQRLRRYYKPPNSHSLLSLSL